MEVKLDPCKHDSLSRFCSWHQHIFNSCFNAGPIAEVEKDEEHGGLNLKGTYTCFIKYGFCMGVLVENYPFVLAQVTTVIFPNQFLLLPTIFWRFSIWHLCCNDSKLCNLAICLVQILLLEFGFVLANESMKVMRSSSSRELLQSSQAGPFGMAPCHMCQLKAVAPHFGLKDANIQGQKFISEAEDSSFFALFSRISQKSIQ